MFVSAFILSDSLQFLCRIQELQEGVVKLKLDLGNAQEVAKHLNTQVC